MSTKKISQQQFYDLCKALCNMADTENKIDHTVTELVGKLGVDLALDLSESTIKTALASTRITAVKPGSQSKRDRDELNHHRRRLVFLEKQMNSMAKFVGFDISRLRVDMDEGK